MMLNMKQNNGEKRKQMLLIAYFTCQLILHINLAIIIYLYERKATNYG